MAAITPQAILGPYPTLPVAANALDITFAAASGSADTFAPTGKEILVVQNVAVGAKTFTITSVADDLKRTGDITTYSLGAGEFAAFAFTRTDGWKNSSGLISVTGEDANIKWAVLRLP